jgi:hypothetical protein
MKTLKFASFSTAGISVILPLGFKYHTPGAEMFGVGDFWLETRVIIKISTHP